MQIIFRIHNKDIERINLTTSTTIPTMNNNGIINIKEYRILTNKNLVVLLCMRISKNKFATNNHIKNIFITNTTNHVLCMYR